MADAGVTILTGTDAGNWGTLQLGAGGMAAKCVSPNFRELLLRRYTIPWRLNENFSQSASQLF